MQFFVTLVRLEVMVKMVWTGMETPQPINNYSGNYPV